MVLKKIMNRSEDFTYRTVKEICDKYNTAVYPKVRLADIFPIENSGIADELYSFALKSHFDVIVIDELGYPLFAVEFDGELHQTLTQVKRDEMKNALCQRFNFPILRITSEHLTNQDTNMNLLSWFIEVWFAAEWFEQAQKAGQFVDESFLPMSVARLPERTEPFPLWLSRKIRGEIFNLKLKGFIENSAPSCLVWRDNRGGFYSLAWLVIDQNTAVMVETQMASQDFPAPMHDLIEDMTINQLYENLTSVLGGDMDKAIVPDIINLAIDEIKEKYGIPFSGGIVKGVNPRG